MNGVSTPEEESADKSSQDVLVIPFGPNTGEFVGLLSEQKVHKSIYLSQYALYSLVSPSVWDIIILFLLNNAGAVYRT